MQLTQQGPAGANLIRRYGADFIAIADEEIRRSCLVSATTLVRDWAPRSVDELSILGEGCVIKPGATIVNSVLGPGVHVDEKSTISNSLIWAHTRIGSNATIDGAVVGRSCYLGRNTHVSPGAVLGDKTSLPDYSRT